MAVDFFFEPATFNITPLSQLRLQWSNIPNEQSLEIIIAEYQYLLFHFYLIKSIQHTGAGKVKNPTHIGKLEWGIRIGIVKVALLLASSIIEEILLAHAIQRGYELPKKEQHRTFGKIIKAWKEVSPKDINNKRWKQIEWLNDARNNIHLHKLVKTKEDFYRALHKEENKYLNGVSDLIDFLKEIKSK